MQSGGVFYGGLIGGVPGRRGGTRGATACARWRTADVLAPGGGARTGHRTPGLPGRRLLLRQARRTSPWAVTFRDMQASRSGGHAAGHAPASDAALRVDRHDPDLRLPDLAGAAQVAGRPLSGIEGPRHLRLPGLAHAAQALPRPGSVAYVMLYAVARFLIEYFRGDAARGLVVQGRLSTSQFIASSCSWRRPPPCPTSPPEAPRDAPLPASAAPAH